MYVGKMLIGFVFVFGKQRKWQKIILVGLRALVGRALMGRALVGRALMGRALMGWARMPPPVQFVFISPPACWSQLINVSSSYIKS